MLPLSLRKLCEAFGLKVTKGYFPFLLSDLSYTGKLPEYELWPKDMRPETYSELEKEYGNKTWNYMDEAIKYCKIDCVCLFDILNKFNELVFKHFNLNIHKSLTLPSLAFKIFKANYMPKDTLFQIKGKIDKDIREAYTGGAVDVYTPHNYTFENRPDPKGAYNILTKVYHKLYYYDFNSLFPHIMSLFEMPVGKPIAFEGNIRKVDPEAFGFFYCLITTPDYLEQPILQRRIKTKDGMRTVAGLGTWYGWVASTEMDAAIMRGYKIQIIKGYKFKKAIIFKEYVTVLYELRKTFDKTHPLNFIAKLLMNTLYGRFGMKGDQLITEIYDLNDRPQNIAVKRLSDSHAESIRDIFKLDRNVIVVRSKLPDMFKDDNDLLDYTDHTDVNVAIAAFITAIARVLMSYFKNNPDFKLYYTDTDSVVLDRPLPEHMVGDKLGQLKLEHVIQKAVFLAPKVYCLINELGEEIIKIKGLSSDVIKRTGINFDTFEKLLQYNHYYDFEQDKFYKDLAKGSVSIIETTYNLKVTSNKRDALYNNNVFTATAPYNYDDIEID